MSIFPDDIFNLADIALDVARKDPERIAVIDLDGFDSKGKRRYKRHTYRELSADAESVAPGLREIGIAERTRVVFMAPPSYETCVIGLALTRVGAATVWIDTAVGYLNITERLGRVGIEAFFGIPIAHLGRLVFGWGPRTLRKLLVTGKPGFPGAHTVASLRREAPAVPPPPQIGPEDPAAILYTTGSTGPAKPALYLQRNFCRLFRQAHHSWRFHEDQEPPVDIAVFPAFLFIPISAGGTMVVPPINFVTQGPADVAPNALLEVINDCGVKSMFGSPVLLENMGRCAVEKGIKTPTLKRIVGAGDVIKAPAKELLLRMMDYQGEVFANYGATEAMPTTEMCARETLKETWDQTMQGAGICVGRPLPGVELRIVSIVDGPVGTIEQTEELSRGEIGEILVRSKQISPRYYKEEASNLKNKIADPAGDSWHRYGDTGYLDDEGRLWVCGRVGHRVKSPSGPLFPLVCEAIFETHPQVKRCGLVGIPGSSGELPVVCIELKPGIRSAEREALREELLSLASKFEPTRAIQHFLFKRSLPLDPRHNSKIERPILAKWAAKQLRKQMLQLAPPIIKAKPVRS